MQNRNVLLSFMVLMLFLGVVSCNDADNDTDIDGDSDAESDTPVNLEDLEGQPCQEGSFYCLGRHTMLVCNKEDLVYRISEYCRATHVDSSRNCYDMFCDDQEGCVSVNSPDGSVCTICFAIPNESNQGLCRDGYCLREETYYADGDDDLPQEEAE